MPKGLLSVPHHSQQSDGDCLAACAAMLLMHLDHATDYPKLLNVLKIEPYGAPASNVRLLESLGLNVTYSKTDLAGLQAMLQEGHPVIVFVRTGELPHWTYNTDHALLVVGYDENLLYANDPARPDAPIAVPQGNFELA